MGNPNLGWAETRERAAEIQVDSYEVEVWVAEANGGSTFQSRTTVAFQAAHPGSHSWVDLIADSVELAVLNGEQLPASHYDGARLRLSGLGATNRLEVRATCRYMNTGEGMHRFVDPVDGQTYLYTQFATADARRVFACFEQPDLKARFTWVVHAPAHWEVVSNSPVQRRSRLGPACQSWWFEPTPPLPTYVTAIVAGPFEAVSGTFSGAAGDIPLGVLCRRSMLAHLDAEAILDVTRSGLRHFESDFARPYPFAKYDQVFLPEFNLGAMENPGVVTFREESFVFRSRVSEAARELRAEVILHELAHMWFGDLVTMRWWDDLWLNESFAEWAGNDAAASATPYHECWTTFALSRKAWALEQDQLPSTHPIAADIPDLESVYLNFDGITYAKGASVLRQLVAWVGQEAFVAGLRTYFRDHAWGSTTVADLLEHLCRASGRDLREWSQQWLRTAGVNTIAAQCQVAPDGTYDRVTLTQAPPGAPAGLPPTIRPHHLRVGGYNWNRQSGSPRPVGAAAVPRALVRAWEHEVDLLGPSVDVAGLVGVPAVDLVLPNDDDLTFAKVRLDRASMAAALGGVSTVGTSLTRAVIWLSVWDCVRDAELPASRFVDAVVANLGTERHIGLLQAVLRCVPEAVFRYTPEISPRSPQPPAALSLRDRLVGIMGAATRYWLLAADPGSDLQLVHVRGMVKWALHDDELELVRDLLSGSTVVPGLAVDCDLRWALLQRLVACGAADSSEVELELAADDTLAGRQAAATAWASIPTESAKQAAWVSLVERDDLPNSLVRATVDVFASIEHAALLERYVQPYFDVVADLWSQRSPGTAATLARVLFPSWSVDRTTVELAAGLLDRRGLPAGLRRIVAEGADDLERALRCQEACSRPDGPGGGSA